MKLNKKPFPLTTIYMIRNQIDPQPDYQRPPAWDRSQKQLLIDSILREYDVPKIYWHSVDRDGFKYEVIDGQQRLRTIWEFCGNEFALAKNSEPVDGIDVSGKKYNELCEETLNKINTYIVDVVIVEDAIMSDEEDEIRDMFLRLQGGTTLKAQEKRNAMTGKMRDFVKELANHKFFQSCKFSNSRFTFDHVAAQLTCLELFGGPTNVQDKHLNNMYQEHKNFDKNGQTAKKVKKVLNYLLKCFPDKTLELERYNVVTLYCLSGNLLSNFVSAGTEKKLREWFINFEKLRRDQETLEEDERDTRMVEYRRLSSQSTDAEASIRYRLDEMSTRFFSDEHELVRVDDTRTFTESQRLAIYRRDDGCCKIKTHCDGEKLGWQNWHADHVLPYSKGGKTSVSNGQVSCPACNYSKGDGV